MQRIRPGPPASPRKALKRNLIDAIDGGPPATAIYSTNYHGRHPSIQAASIDAIAFGAGHHQRE